MEHLLVSDQLQVSLLTAGAEINSVKNKTGLEFLWQAKPEIWPRHAPVLFPIVGKLKDNTFHFKGKTYSMSQHGFARDRVFEITESSADSCTFQLRANEGSKAIYPFGFVFEIKYVLKQNTLTTHYTVINPSEEPVLFCVGAHPGFICPLPGAGRFEDHYLTFEASHYQIRELNNGLRKAENTGAYKDLILKDNRLYLSNVLFDNDALVFENKQICKISLESDTSPHKITLECPDWPYFGIWSKKGCEEFVCLEPWYGIADHESTNQNLEEKDGILKLEPQKSFHCCFSVTFE